MLIVAEGLGRKSFEELLCVILFLRKVHITVKVNEKELYEAPSRNIYTYITKSIFLSLHFIGFKKKEHRVHF